MDISLNQNNLSSKVITLSLKEEKENQESDNLVIKSQKHILSKDILNGVMDYTMELSKGAVKEILGGNIDRRPLQTSDKPACEHCVYKSICGLMYLPNKQSRKARKVEFEDFAILKDKKEEK